MWMHTSDPAAEGRSVVTGESPEDAPGGDVVPDEGTDRGYEDQEKKPDSAGGGAGGLLVDYSDRERRGASEDFVEVGDGVEDSDDVAHYCDEAGG